MEKALHKLLSMLVVTVLLIPMVPGMVMPVSADTPTEYTLTEYASGFNEAYSMFIDSEDNIYVADLGEGSIIKIAASDQTQTTVVSEIHNGPLSVAVDGSENIYYTVYNFGNVYKYDGADTYDLAVCENGSGYVIGGLGIDDDGSIYASLYSPAGESGTSIAAIAPAFDSYEELSPAGEDALLYPAGLAVGSDGYLYIADGDNHKVKKMDTTDGSIAATYSYPEDAYPWGVAVSPTDGSVYSICGNGDDSVTKLNSDFTLAAVYPDVDAQSIVAGSDGTVYVLSDNTIYTLTESGGGGGEFDPTFESGLPDGVLDAVQSGGSYEVQCENGTDWDIDPNGSEMAALQPTTENDNYSGVADLFLMNSSDIDYIDTYFNSPSETDPEATYGITNVAYLYADIELTENEEYQMAWNYVSTDYVPYNDGSFVSFVNIDNPSSIPLINGVRAGVSILGATVPGTGNYSTGSYGSTGWQTVTLKANAAGTYRLGFAVFNLSDKQYSPYLFLDDSQGVTWRDGQEFAPIPKDENAPPPAGDVTEFTITYDDNGSDSGTVPLDGAHYEEGDTVTVLGNDGELTKAGYAFDGWNTEADGTGISYAAESMLTMGTEDITLYAKWKSNTATPPSPHPSGNNNTNNNTIPVEQDGTTIQVPGTVSTGTENGQTTTVIKADDTAIQSLVAQGEAGTIITLPVNTNSDVVVGELNGQTVKDMEGKEAVLEIKTENVTYTLPASQINIDNVSAQIGQQVELKDISVKVTISAPPENTVRIVEDTASKNNYQVVVKPIEFNITCTSGNKTVDVSKFNGYVERTVAIPDGIDPSKITTGIVLNADGTFSHVPTSIIIIDGKYYAKINSLTNSTYSVIYSPNTFKDVDKHWAKDAVNDMASRLVISGVGNDMFEPDRDITRSEFAAIVVRALGLMRPGTGKDSFGDVSKDDWYYDAVSIAYENGILSGFGNGEFKPMDKISREQAMTMIARAMKLTGLSAVFKAGEAEQLLAAYGDSGKASAWAKDSVASCIKTGVVSGRSGNLVAPKDNITRAEVAVIVQRLLEKSDLI